MWIYLPVRYVIRFMHINLFKTVYFNPLILKNVLISFSYHTISWKPYELKFHVKEFDRISIPKMRFPTEDPLDRIIHPIL